MIYLVDGFFKSLIDFPPFLYALIAGVCIGIIAPLIGSVVVIRRLSFIADTLSHFSLAGVTFGVFISKFIPNTFFIHPIYLGVIFSILSTFLIEKLRGFYKNYKELSMPIVMSFGVALSGIFIAISDGISTSFTTGLLFGSLMSVILVVSILIIVFATIYYKQIISLCFDEVNARISGVNVKVLQTIITMILAVVISLFIDFVGVLLISALLIVPVAASILIGDSFRGTIVTAIIISEASILTGFYISFYLRLPIGATVVLLNVIVLFITMLIVKIRKYLKNKELSEQKQE
jgi:zinc transport system permease protein